MASKVISFTSEREFVQHLHEGKPVAVAFTIKCPFTKHFDELLEEAASESHPHVKFAVNQGKHMQSKKCGETPFNYDVSTYGFREFFKRHGIQSSEPK